MNEIRVRQLLLQHEGIRLEFKEAKTALPTTLFETICAFLNRSGGDILLGVKNNGVVVGVETDKVEQLMTDLVNHTNNPQKLDPPFILAPQVYNIDGKTVVHVQVPESSQVHKTKGMVYDRSSDGDYHLKSHHQIAELYNRKRTYYTENFIYPAIKFEDFNPELFPKIRNLIRSREPTHPWLALDDVQLLQKANLYRRDLQSGQEGYTLAAALLFGRDEIIHSILPHYKTDALVRRQNLARYDDRLVVQTNLIDAYDKLMDFIAKHLPDSFHTEGRLRISLRSIIFREVVANLLVHREFTNAFPAKLIIYASKVVTENANRPSHHGLLLSDAFAPFPKNPIIAKFFNQIGYVEELGSGILNINKYLPLYMPGQVPVFEENDVFKTTIPLVDDISSNVILIDKGMGKLFDNLSSIIKERRIKILSLVLANSRITISLLASFVGVSEPTIKRDLKVLREMGLLRFVGSLKTGHYEPAEALQELISSNDQRVD